MKLKYQKKKHERLHKRARKILRLLLLNLGRCVSAIDFLRIIPFDATLRLHHLFILQLGQFHLLRQILQYVIPRSFDFNLAAAYRARVGLGFAVVAHSVPRQALVDRRMHVLLANGAFQHLQEDLLGLPYQRVFHVLFRIVLLLDFLLHLLVDYGYRVRYQARAKHLFHRIPVYLSGHALRHLFTVVFVQVEFGLATAIDALETMLPVVEHYHVLVGDGD